MIADAAQERLEKLGPKGQQDIPPDLSMVIWKDAIGERGPFQVAEAKANANNPSFSRLMEYLNGHEGKATISGYFAWRFTDTSGSIGRKLKEKQP